MELELFMERPFSDRPSGPIPLGLSCYDDVDKPGRWALSTGTLFASSERWTGGEPPRRAENGVGRAFARKNPRGPTPITPLAATCARLMVGPATRYAASTPKTPPIRSIDRARAPCRSDSHRKTRSLDNPTRTDSCLCVMPSRTRAFFTRSAKVRSRKTQKGTGMVGPRPFKFSDKRVPVRLLWRSAEGVHLFDAALGESCGVDDLLGVSGEMLATDVEFGVAILDDVAGPVALESEVDEVDRVAVDEEPDGDGVSLPRLPSERSEPEGAAVFHGGEAVFKGLLGHRGFQYHRQ